MGDIRNEPSMEEILASIKRIIAEDGPGPSAGTRPKRATPPVNADPPLELDNPIEDRAIEDSPIEDRVDESNEESGAEPSAAPSEEVLELTQAINAQVAEPQDGAPEPRPAMAQSNAQPGPRLVSEGTANASRDALAALSALLIKPEGEAASNTLEGLMREMLRPMLKEWLDARLPELVQGLVEKEIARISGRVL